MWGNIPLKLISLLIEVDLEVIVACSLVRYAMAYKFGFGLAYGVGMQS